jgi:uncharacterized membrane protein YcaP (DUF421 family)
MEFWSVIVQVVAGLVLVMVVWAIMGRAAR